MIFSKRNCEEPIDFILIEIAQHKSKRVKYYLIVLYINALFP